MVFYFYIKNLFSYFMSNGIMNSVDILYTPNIEDVKNYKNYASPNTFIVSSYYNTGSYIGFNYYGGLSYELYYIDDNKKINQLSYNLVPGNGLNIENNKFEVNIDEKTLVNKYYNGKRYIVVNMDSLKQASALNRGLLFINNNLYYNDTYLDTCIDDDVFTLKGDNIDISNGLAQDLNTIEIYYKKCISLLELIDALYLKCSTDLSISKHIEVGDILYYDQTKQKYSLEPQTKSGINNTPVMVCVISSNVLPDGYPRFIPLKRKKKSYIYDKLNTIYLKNALNQIPIYVTNDIDEINLNTSIKGASSGFIAVKRDSWKSNVANPFEAAENYYSSTNKSTIYSYTDVIEPEPYIPTPIIPGVTTVVPGITTIVLPIYTNINVNWYVDCSKINYNNNYAIEQFGVYTQVISPTQIPSKVMNSTIYVIVTIKFNNNISKYYVCNLKYHDNRFTNMNKVYGYNLKKTITNNFTETSNNVYENYYSLLYKDLKESSTTINEHKQKNIVYTTLSTIDTNFTETSAVVKETYVITNKKIELTDTKLDMSVISNVGNKVTLNITTSTAGKVLLTTNGGTLSSSTIIMYGTSPSATVFLTNSGTKDINATIIGIFVPSDANKYKQTSKSINVNVNGVVVKNTVQDQITNHVVTTENNTNNNTSTKTTTTKNPTSITVVSNGKVYESSIYSGGC